jgi:uncharacterized protein (DUF4415 family)
MKNRGEIATPRENADEIELGDEFWQNVQIIIPENKASIHLRVDKKVLDFFKSQGKGHLTRMNSVLRAYVESKENAKIAG